MASQYWSTKRSKTCQECVISNGRWSVNTCHDRKASDKKQTLKNLFNEAALCKNPAHFCSATTFDLSTFASNAKYKWSLGVITPLVLDLNNGTLSATILLTYQSLTLEVLAFKLRACKKMSPPFLDFQKAPKKPTSTMPKSKPFL